MPATSRAQFRFMQWIAHGKGTAPGLSRAKAKEFVDATPSYRALPEKKKEQKRK